MISSGKEGRELDRIEPLRLKFTLAGITFPNINFFEQRSIRDHMNNKIRKWEEGFKWTDSTGRL